jgi:hypothetical protein
LAIIILLVALFAHSAWADYAIRKAFRNGKEIGKDIGYWKGIVDHMLQQRHMIERRQRSSEDLAFLTDEDKKVLRSFGVIV